MDFGFPISDRWWKMSEPGFSGNEKSTRDYLGFKGIRALLQQGTYPKETITPEPSVLDTEALWRYVPEKQRQIRASTPQAPAFTPTSIKAVQEFYVAEHIFLLRVLQRLEFQCFVNTCQLYEVPAKDDNADDAAASAFIDSRSWLETMFYTTFPKPKEDEEGEDTLQWIRAALSILLKSGEEATDVFENPLNRVPLGIISQKDIEDALQAFKAVEEVYLETTGQLGKVTKDQNTLLEKIQSVGQMMRNTQQDYDDELKKLVDIPVLITEAIAVEEAKKKALQHEADMLKDEIKNVIDCDISRIIESLSTVLMFVDPKSGRASVGGYASIGLATYQATTESLTTIATSGGGRIEKQYLLDRIDTYTGTSTQELQATLRNALDRNEAAKGKQEDYLAQLKVDEERFNSMCDQYLGKMKGAMLVRIKLKEMMSAVQAKHALIAQYNRVFTRLAEMELQTQHEKTIQASLQSQVGAVSDVSLQAVAAFMTAAYNQIGKTTLKLVYSMVRAFNCASFRYSGVIGLLRPLHCFADISAQLLDVAVKTRLNQDFGALFQSWAKRPAAVETLSIWLTKANNGSLIEDFKDSAMLSFDLGWEEALKAGFDESWWDVRLEWCEIYLYGASAESKIIRLKVSNTGTFRFYDKEGKLHIFDLDTNVRAFAYKHDADMQPVGRVTESVPGETFALTFAGTHPAVYLQSPLTGWTVEAGSGVNLTGLDKVELRMKIQYRTK